MCGRVGVSACLLVGVCVCVCVCVCVYVCVGTVTTASVNMFCDTSWQCPTPSSCEYDAMSTQAKRTTASTLMSVPRDRRPARHGRCVSNFYQPFFAAFVTLVLVLSKCQLGSYWDSFIMKVSAQLPFAVFVAIIQVVHCRCVPIYLLPYV